MSRNLATEDERDPYILVSSDSHAGASMLDYRGYLESCWFDDFDAWSGTYVDAWTELDRANPSRVLAGILSSTPETPTIIVGTASDRMETNWDSALRQKSVEADGIVGEVLFPNTVPPFFPRLSLSAPNPSSRDEYEHRLAGLRAHNRWLVDFCAQLPGRRAGVAQIFINDVDVAVNDIRWAKDAGLTGGVLLPGVAPGDGIPELFDPAYEPIWDVCEELEIPLNHHGGGGGHVRYHSDASLITRSMYLLEVRLWGHRLLWHLIFSGVFERHPGLKLVFTEQGSGWVPGVLSTLDHLASRMREPGTSEALFAQDAISLLSLMPSEYFARNCWMGASGMSPAEGARCEQIGVDKIMWGSDFPHSESSFPFSKEALRMVFANTPPSDIRKMVGATAAKIYKLDRALLAEAAMRVGPSVEETSRPLTEIPDEAKRIVSFDSRDVVHVF